MRVVVDIEADNLYDLATKIHCVCFRDIDTDKTWAFSDALDIKSFIKHSGMTHVIGANIIGYDLPMLRKLWGIGYNVGRQDMWLNTKVEFIDTFHLSQFLNPDRAGGHSLDNLAKLAGGPLKQDYKGGFEALTSEMLEYCLADTAATASVYKYLMKECEVKYAND